MDDFVGEILIAARREAGSGSWLARLPDDVAASMNDVRKSWRAIGVGRPSATAVAKTICLKLTQLGHKMPKYRQVQRWLTEN